MLNRLYGHFNLLAQFLIIAAFYLSFNPKIQRRKRYWGFLLATAVMIHPYFLIMLLMIWIADLTKRKADHQCSAQEWKIEIATLLLLVVFFCWQTGYFSILTGLSVGEFSSYRMNVLSVINPSGWSYLLKPLSNRTTQFEGFNFLGLGIILLWILNIPILFKERVEILKALGRYHLLCIVLIGFTIFSISNHVGIGSFQFEYPLPKLLLKGANVFRASGRMFWPMGYMLILTAIFLVIRKYQHRTAILLLSIALIIQVLDTHAGWSIFRTRFMHEEKSTWNTPLTDSIWKVFASKYHKLRWIQIADEIPHWQFLAHYAATHGLATDVVQFARWNQDALINRKNQIFTSLQKGKYESDSLYILADSLVSQAIKTMDLSTDAFGKINGFNVLAPGWKTCKDCLDFNQLMK